MTGSVNGPSGFNIVERVRALAGQVQEGVESAADALGLKETLSNLDKMLVNPTPLDRLLGRDQPVETTPSGRANEPAATPTAAPTPAQSPAPQTQEGHRLGSLSEVYESGKRGPGTVSGGVNDPGGVSYGVYQLSSKAGTLNSFLQNEGQRWSKELGSPTDPAFKTRWQAIAAREPQAFRDAQHGFIERTHYHPAVDAVKGRTGLDLNSRHDAVRDATWSVSVQHAGASTILNRAVAATDRQVARDDPGYDKALIDNIYKERTAYVLDAAKNPKLSAGERQQLIDITNKRYPAERADALKMLETAPAATPQQQPASEAPKTQPAAEQRPTQTGTVDGNALARENGIGVKSDAVKIGKLDANMAPVFAAVAQAAREQGLPQPVITSGNDSRHMNGSRHYDDKAVDFRGNNITDAQGERLEARVRELLGPNYDVDFEKFPSRPSNDHLHVEYDPN